MGIIRSFAALWIAHFILDFFVGVWPIFKTLAGIDVLQAGIVIGIGGFIGELSQLFFGIFSDRGYRKAILLLGVVLSSAVLLVTTVYSFFLWFVLVLLLMLGSGAFHPSANGMASALAPKHPGKAVLIFASGGALGLGSSQLLFTKVLDRFNGQAYVLFIPVVVVFFYLLWHRFPQVEAKQKNSSLRAFVQPIMNHKKALIFLYLAQVANQMVFVSFLFLLPDVLFSRGCHSWLCMGGGHMCFIMGSALAMVLAGFLCDRYGHRVVLLTVLGGALVTFYAFLVQRTLALHANVITLSMLGAFLGVSNPVVISWGNRLVPESPSTVSALLMGFAWCVGNLAPIFAGLLVKQFVSQAYLLSLACMGLFLVASFAFTFFVPVTSSVQELD